MFESALRSRPAFLASVTGVAEAETALENGANIIDCKDPAQGALGALPLAVTHEIAARMRGRVPVSATVGDLPSSETMRLVEAVEATASAGIDIVKVGFFGAAADADAVAALGRARLGSARLFAVIMADRARNLDMAPQLARSGFLGVMLDTADKTAGRLPQILETSAIEQFLGLSRGHGLFVGLAGSLEASDIAPLTKLGPDILGFRGALCGTGRTGRIEARRVAHIQAEISRARGALARCVA